MMKLMQDDPLNMNDCDAEANDAESVTSMDCTVTLRESFFNLILEDDVPQYE